jgi:2-hydroxy-3-oxopropionate reductase
MQKTLRVGFIGLGIMGRPMAKHVLDAGYALSVYNRTASKAQELVDAGAKLCASPKEVAENSDVIITIVSDTPDVEAVLFGENGVVHGAENGAVVIDMSTISPQQTRLFSQRLAAAGIDMLDCPVSGGEGGAIAATLTIMCGGKEQAFAKALPVLETMGKKVTLMGESGAGQATKLCNQVCLAGALLGVCESLMLATKEGLDCHKVIDVLSGGAANSHQLVSQGPKMVDRDYRPGFFVDLFQKDLRLCASAAQANHLSLPGTSLVAQLYNAVQGIEGSEAMGSQALVLALENLCGVKVGQA